MKDFESYNKEQYHWQAPLLFGIIFFIIGVYLDKINFANSIQICIFVALFWYSFETRENNKIEQKPIVDLFYRPRTNKHEEYFRLRNSGKGVAYNIKVEPIIVKNIDDNEYIFSFCIKDPNLMLVPLGDEKTLNTICEQINPDNKSKLLTDNNQEALKIFENLALAKSVRNFQEIQFKVSFENINRKKFERIFGFFYDKKNHICRVSFKK